MALPGSLAGILWMLFVTQTRVSVPALMGAIMSIGLGVANSILLVTFANERRAEGADALTAALAAGYTRLRPVLMTAAAMVIGMIPMALGFGQGGEQNAPLGRAVIGGLVSFTDRNAAPGLVIPATVMVVRADGSYAVAAVGADEKVRYVRIQVGKDFGAETEIASGLNGGERLIVNPADDLAEGAQVRVVSEGK